MVKVSVVIPFYNVEDYFEECVSSIVNQTLKDIEIICINDGSTDNSLKILEQFANSDDRIKVFSQENRGVSASRNRGIKLAQGEYIYFMDSDDILDLNALEELYDFSKSNDLDILIFKLISFNNETGERYSIDYYDMPFLKPFNKKVFNYKDIGHDTLKISVSPPGKLFKRDLIASMQFAEGLIFEDNLFYSEAMLKAKRVSFIDEYYYNRRVRSHSLMTSKTIKYADFITITNMIFDLFKRENVYMEFRKPLFVRKIYSTNSKLSQVDDEYKEEFFQRMKNDFSDYKEEFENDDVFNNELEDYLKYWFKAALISDNYKEYKLKLDSYRKEQKKKKEKKDKENKNKENKNKENKDKENKDKEKSNQKNNRNDTKNDKNVSSNSSKFKKSIKKIMGAFKNG